MDGMTTDDGRPKVFLPLGMYGRRSSQYGRRTMIAHRGSRKPPATFDFQKRSATLYLCKIAIIFFH